MDNVRGERDRCAGYMHNLRYPALLLTLLQHALLEVNTHPIKHTACL
jgi:hypothetical protein